MHDSARTDPAERGLLRFFYRGWRPTRMGLVANRIARLLFSLGLSTKEAAVLEVRGRKSGRPRSLPVVVASVANQRYLVSMLGAGSEWVKNVEAAAGEAVLHQRGRQRVRLEQVPPRERAPILREYMRVADSGRHHFPVSIDAPLCEFEKIADHYPVYRIVPSARDAL